jgi:prephenate dehydratase
MTQQVPQECLQNETTSAACIASKLAAELYSLEILKENIEDSNINRTRFIILAKERKFDHGNKCSITFTTEHKSGTLFNTLEIFARAGINLTRIESIPTEPGQYSFLLDWTVLIRPCSHDALKPAEGVTSGYSTGVYNEIICNCRYDERRTI